jgi:hypothetical protein
LVRLGVCGLSASILGVKYVLLTDIVASSQLFDNITATEMKASNKVSFIQFNWLELNLIPNEIIRPRAVSISNNDGQINIDDINNVWDTVLCSDVLYESSTHASLLQLINTLKFKKLFLSYKRRHDELEYKFFKSLIHTHNIFLVDNKKIEVFNLSLQQRVGLYIFIVIPRTSATSSIHVIT